MASAVGSCVLLKDSFVKRKLRNEENSKGFRVFCGSSSSSSVSTDPYKTLKIHPGVTESEVKKAFRQLALQYHPDVCRGSNCSIQFQQINEAYDIVMSTFRDEQSRPDMEPYNSDDDDDRMRGLNDQDWDLWEEWMGWEGAGIRDYSSHINPYI